MKPLFYLSLLALSSFAFANSPLPNHRHIAITGYGETSVKPDIAILHLSVEHTDKKSAEAKAEVDKRFNALLKGLKKFDIKESDIVASRIATSPRYEYSQEQRKQLHVGYSANRTIKVTVNDLNLLSDVMDLALSVEVNQIQHLEMASSKEEELQQKAVELAIENAKSNGAALANAFGASLGKVYSIDAQNHEQIRHYSNMEKMGSARMISADMGSVSPGTYLQDELTFKATINVVFDIKSKS
ncbi:SIMPL domain-containing protein [Pseudoalteromonas sp. SSM20]|uniref:SIMPL domain-containing protein n=1 Tax=Pseudoalteromonas sp. SSM20 TaxID=3139394 RepID=UPI003BAA13A4